MKVIGYARVSTAEQALEGVSLEAQKRRIRGQAYVKGWELVSIEADKRLSKSRRI